MKLTERNHLEIFKKLSEEKIGWGRSEDWSSADFEKLSELIFEKTGISLSTTTLKRVWGKIQYHSIPSTTTLNTLAQFLDYESWRCFCIRSQPSEPESVETTSPGRHEIKVKPLWRQRPLRKLATLCMIGLILAAALVWMSFFNKPVPVYNLSKVTFTSKVLTDDLPNSVVFDYDVGKISADSVIIQQSWDPARRETVSADKHQHTSIYYVPGYFKAKLLVNNHIASQREVFIKTQGWKGIVQGGGHVRPFYLSNREIEKEGNNMDVSPELLKAKTGSTVFNDTWSTFFNVREFDEVDPKRFTLNATLQNTSTKEASICQQVKVYVLTKQGYIFVPLCAKGCTSDISVDVANNRTNGKDNDLSAFGCDFSQPHDLSIEVKDEKGLIYIDKKLALSTTFSRPFGPVVGMIVGFEGSGSIKNISLK